MGQVEGDYLPGCYRNLEAFTDESLTGYLLRLAEANGYRGIRGLLRAAGLLRPGALRPQLLSLHADQHHLSRISRMAVGDAAHLARYFCEPLPPPPSSGEAMEALYRLARRVDVDGMLSERAAVCVQCLLESAYIREEWDLAPVTVCAAHKVLLIDECPGCEAALTWERPQINHCGKCGDDLRAFGAQPASESVVSVAEDFAALAPFRLVDHEGRMHVVDWDEMFKAFKALLLPDRLWALGEFPPIRVARTTVAERHELIERLASVRADARYRMPEFSGKARQALAPFAAIPVSSILEDLALYYLEAEVGLSRELAGALLACDPSQLLTAVEVFGSAPPAIETQEGLAAHLNATAEEISHLIKLRVIRPRSKSAIAFDADDLLRARKYLDSLVGPEGLSRLVGVPVTAADLHPDGLFPRWNPSCRTDHRVAPERLVELQRDLIVLWQGAEAPTEPVALRLLASSADRPLEVVTAIVKDITMRTIRRFAWKPPFTWLDIAVDRTELCALARVLRHVNDN